MSGNERAKLYYSHNLNPRVAVAVARHLGSPVDYIRASPRHPDHEPAFRSINPNALVPVLVEGGRTLWETDAASTLYFEKLIRPTFSDVRVAPSVLEAALGDFRDHAAVLDGQLAGRPWLVGDHLSYADFRAATALPFAEGAGLPVSEFPNVKRWHDRLWALDAWRAPFDGLA